MFKQNGLLLNVETGTHELAILSYATVCLHRSVSLNTEKICRAFSEQNITVCEKTAGLRSGNSSDLNSACLKVLVPVEIFSSHDMHYETERYRHSTDGLLKQKNRKGNLLDETNKDQRFESNRSIDELNIFQKLTTCVCVFQLLVLDAHTDNFIIFN